MSLFAFCLIATMMNKHDKLDDTSLSFLSSVTACAFFWVAKRNFRIMQLIESRKHYNFFMLMCLNDCATELGMCVCVNEKQRKCRLNSLNGNCQHSGWHSAPSKIYANFRHDLLHVQTKQLHFRPPWFGSWRHFRPHFLRFLRQTISSKKSTKANDSVRLLFIGAEQKRTGQFIEVFCFDYVFCWTVFFVLLEIRYSFRIKKWG